jgi:hypothetical protein
MKDVIFDFTYLNIRCKVFFKHFYNDIYIFSIDWFKDDEFIFNSTNKYNTKDTSIDFMLLIEMRMPVVLRIFESQDKQKIINIIKNLLK